MTPERWQQIDTLFRAALELEEPRQERFLADRCADDSDLYHEVASLLAADCRADHSLEQAVAAEAADLRCSRSETREGEMVGAYEISRLLGKGGMGAVYLAASPSSAVRDTRSNVFNDLAKKSALHSCNKCVSGPES